MDIDLNIATNMSLSILSRSVMVYGRLWFLLNKISFVDLVYSQGKHDQHSRAKMLAGSQGEHNPLPLISKGENEFKDIGIAIKSKGGDCWHYDFGMAL